MKKTLTMLAFGLFASMAINAQSAEKSVKEEVKSEKTQGCKGSSSANSTRGCKGSVEQMLECKGDAKANETSKPTTTKESEAKKEDQPKNKTKK